MAGAFNRKWASISACLDRDCSTHSFPAGFDGPSYAVNMNDRALHNAFKNQNVPLPGDARYYTQSQYDTAEANAAKGIAPPGYDVSDLMTGRNQDSPEKLWLDYLTRVEVWGSNCDATAATPKCTYDNTDSQVYPKQFNMAFPSIRAMDGNGCWHRMNCLKVSEIPTMESCCVNPDQPNCDAWKVAGSDVRDVTSTGSPCDDAMMKYCSGGTPDQPNLLQQRCQDWCLTRGQAGEGGKCDASMATFCNKNPTSPYCKCYYAEQNSATYKKIQENPFLPGGQPNPFITVSAKCYSDSGCGNTGFPSQFIPKQAKPGYCPNINSVNQVLTAINSNLVGVNLGASIDQTQTSSPTGTTADPGLLNQEFYGISFLMIFVIMMIVLISLTIVYLYEPSWLFQ